MDDRVEVLGFVDFKRSVDWISSAGGKVINLLAKGSEKHCREQLGKTLDQHIVDIQRTVDYAHDQGLAVNMYLEDWSNGMRTSPEYVFQIVENPQIVFLEPNISVVAGEASKKMFQFEIRDLENEKLAYLQDLLPTEKVDICFLLSVCMWLTNWKELIDFVQKNIIPASAINTSELVQQLIKDGNTNVVEKDVNEQYHFNGNFNNVPQGLVDVCLPLTGPAVPETVEPCRWP